MNNQVDTKNLPVILVTGMSGLLGSTVVDVLSDRYKLVGMDLSDPVNPVDITNATQVNQMLAQYPKALALIHAAAFTDVTAAWQQKGDTNGIAYKVNVTGTEVIAQACQDHQVPLIHISTAYVFDGNKEKPYTETDALNPIEWYGYTKAKAEDVVAKLTTPWSIVRIDQPFRTKSFVKPDVLRKMSANLSSQKPYPLFSDHFIGPTFLDDLALVLEWLATSSSTGVFHATSGETWTDFELGTVVAQYLKVPTPTEGSLVEYLKQTNRPYQKNTSLDCTKLHQLYQGPRHSIQEALKLTLLP